MVPTEWVYLIACLPFILVWAFLFFRRKDLRGEMLFTGILIGLMSVATAYYWWTIDWWHPATITGTRVGVEDFVIGFFTGGIMAAAYEVLFRKRLYKAKAKAHHLGGLTLLLLLGCLTSWLFWGVGISSFYASSIAMIIVATILFWDRRDLIIDGLLSGALMAFVSLSFYITIILISPDWIQQTYHWDGLSGILIRGVPIEEFIFWFLAGVLFGPFYEYAKSEGLRRLTRRMA